jgi:hypothetical protein
MRNITRRLWRMKLEPTVLLWTVAGQPHDHHHCEKAAAAMSWSHWSTVSAVPAVLLCSLDHHRQRPVNRAVAMRRMVASCGSGSRTAAVVEPPLQLQATRPSADTSYVLRSIGLTVKLLLTIM